jgi:hypothetical protein
MHSEINKIRVAITVIAALLITAHLIWPNLKVDAVTIGLLLVGILPWLSGLLKSLKLPGGYEVTFQDLSKAAKEVTDSLGTGDASEDDSIDVFTEVVELDSNLALAYLRIEIEKRLRELANEAGIDPQRMPLTRLMNELSSAGLLPQSARSGLDRLIYAGNHAAHGVEVEPGVAQWAMREGPEILRSLDSHIESSSSSSSSCSHGPSSSSSGR